MNTVSLDARQVRTRAALTAAILRLAQDHAASDISMAQLAREAGVHRTTLYQHLPSPSEWLSSVLQRELDTLRETHLELPADGDLSAASRDVALAVLAHLEDHAVIYQRELALPRSPLGTMLGEHFATSVRQLIDTHTLGPAGLDVPRELFRELASRWIAEAAVGAMTAWLASPAPRDPEIYLKIHATLLPEWWPQ